MSLLDMLGDLLSAWRAVSLPTPPVVVVRPTCVHALPAADGGTAPGLDDDAPEILAADPGGTRDPDAPHDVELRLAQTDLYWLLVLEGQHVEAGDDPETAAVRVMADIELRGVEDATR